MTEKVRIDALSPTVVATRDYVVPAMKDGLAVKLSVDQLMSLILLEDLPADPALAALTSALAGKADKVTPFVDVASASTVDLGAAASSSVNITGTTTITGFGASAPDGAEYLLKFAGSLTVTHGASLLLPEAANVVTYAGMTMRVRKEPSNVWRVIWYSSRLGVSGGGANLVKFDASFLTATRTITLPNADVDLGLLSTLSLTKSYESAEQAITASGALTLAHGLGVYPKIVTAVFVCKTAELGYSVGDRLHYASSNASSGTADRGLAVVTTSTNIEVRYGATILVLSKNAGGSALLTAANWRLVLRAYA